MIFNEIIDCFIKNNGEVIVNSVFGGGAYTFLLNKSLAKPIIIVDTRSNYIESGNFNLKYIYKDIYEDIVIMDLDELFSVVENRVVYINHLIWSTNMNNYIQLLLQLKSKYKLDLKMYIHDFYSVCPSINLLNYKNEYCGIPDDVSCNACLKFYEFSNVSKSFNQTEVMLTQDIHCNKIDNWRKLWRQLFDEIEVFIFPSNSAMNIWLKAFPNYSDRVSILHHDLSYTKTIKASRSYSMSDFFQVYIIGDIGVHKGSTIIHEILSLISIKKLPIKINILGFYDNQVFANTPYLEFHGRFDHNNIGEIINSKSIHCFIVPSICPETFSYVTQEMIATNLPIIAFNIGAQGQFVSEYKYGVTVNVGAELMFEEIILLYEKHKQILYGGLYQNCAEVSVVGDFIRKHELNLIERCEMYNSMKLLKSDLQLRVDEIHRIHNTLSWRITRILRFLTRLRSKVIRVLFNR